MSFSGSRIAPPLPELPSMVLRFRGLSRARALASRPRAERGLQNFGEVPSHVGAFEEKQGKARVGRVALEACGPRAILTLCVHQFARSPHIPVVFADFLDVVDDCRAFQAEKEVVEIGSFLGWRLFHRAV